MGAILRRAQKQNISILMEVSPSRTSYKGEKAQLLN